MSQTVPSLSTGKASNGLWYGSAGKANSGQKAQAFDQTLISMLLGNAKLQEGQVSVQLLALSGMQGANGNAEEEGTLETLTSLIEGLLQKLPELDDALQDNSSLLAALQGWLQNFQNLMQPKAGVETQTSGEQSTEVPELPALAQHSETIRFALQDALVQLLAAVSSGEQATVAATSSQTGSLLESLQSLLQDLPDTKDAKQADSKNESKAVQQAITVVEKGAQSGSKGNLETNGDSQKNNNTQSVLAANQKSNAMEGKFTVVDAAQLTEDGIATEGKLNDNDSPLQTGNVVTAGQLVLRDNGTAPVKHASQPIPVENFGKEMSGFLVNKLEIVKLQGMSEARITLYPEHLGHVDVKITMQGGQLVAQFVTEHAFAKESLEQQMAQLRSALQSQGLQVSKLEVTQNSSLSSHMYHDGRQSGNGNGHQQTSKRRTSTEDDAIAINDLNEEWNEWVAEVRAKEQSYGSSFVARA
ncbi:flagellar hook-length control protein FliK [Paenibacillus puldeungensis]|uniref:Flagellar hook-length control protein FliK n=1 Tax=Paenibacillus puldeungensis TaxID=696536 RepID=A0ABW3RY80_9BACL